MRGYSQARVLRTGAITLVVMALVVAATFNLGKFPGFGGDSYYAYFSDASGIHRGNQVLVGGIRSGRVQDVTLDGSKVLVKFEVDKGVEFGAESRASVEVFNLLGEKYLKITPAGDGQLDQDTPIALDHTEAAYDIVSTFSDLTTTTEDIDKNRLKKALDVLAGITTSAAPEIQDSLTGISRLSRTVSSRDTELRGLLASANRVSKVLANRRTDLVDLMGDADLVFREVRKRKAAIHRLLLNARTLVTQLRGVATDNQAQIAPALREVDQLLDTLNSRDKELKATLAALGPYSSILSNIIGTGPWFDAYASNLLAIPTGEFVPELGGG